MVRRPLTNERCYWMQYGRERNKTKSKIKKGHVQDQVMGCGRRESGRLNGCAYAGGYYGKVRPAGKVSPASNRQGYKRAGSSLLFPAHLGSPVCILPRKAVNRWSEAVHEWRHRPRSRALAFRYRCRRWDYNEKGSGYMVKTGVILIPCWLAVVPYYCALQEKDLRGKGRRENVE